MDRQESPNVPYTTFRTRYPLGKYPFTLSKKGISSSTRLYAKWNAKCIAIFSSCMLHGLHFRYRKHRQKYKVDRIIKLLKSMSMNKYSFQHQAPLSTTTPAICMHIA